MIRRIKSLVAVVAVSAVAAAVASFAVSQDDVKGVAGVPTVMDIDSEADELFATEVSAIHQRLGEAIEDHRQRTSTTVAEQISTPSTSESTTFSTVELTTTTTIPASTTATPSALGRSLYASPTGADTAAGTETAPFKTVTALAKALRPGDIGYVRTGTYLENVNLTVTPGTAALPIVLRNQPGERPVIQGLVWVKSAHHWTFDGINVTWNQANTSTQHMIKLSDSSNWRWTNSEIWGARSYAGMSVHNTSAGWRIDHNYIHDTYKANDTNQDHLIYVSAPVLTNGVIERNLLVNSPNGRGVKIGTPSKTTVPMGAITVRYNTMVNNLGPSNVQLSYSATGNQIYRNILVHPAPGRASITDNDLTGDGNLIHDNVSWESVSVIEAGVPKLVDGGGNLMADPALDSEYRPTNPAVTGYGHLAQGGPE